MTTEHVIENAHFRTGRGAVGCSCGAAFARSSAAFEDDDARNRAIKNAYANHSGHGTFAEYLAGAHDEAEANKVARDLWVECAGCSRRFRGDGIVCPTCRWATPTPSTP
jgi:hypothetical protein